MKEFLLGNQFDNKPFYKRPIFIIGASLVGLILLIIIIAAASSSSEDIEDTGENISFIPNEKNVKFLGRAIMQEGVLFLGYSNTGAEFKVKARRLNITILGDSGATGKVTETSARIAIFVDNERVLDEMISEKNQTFAVFEKNEVKECTVRVLKISECSRSMVGLESIHIDSKGTISPTKQKNLKIEFIGDSITCGYGIDDPDLNGSFKTSTEDSSKAYPYKVSKSLDADYSVVATSGAGIISGWTGNGEKQTSNLVPDYYTKLGFSWGNSFMGIYPQHKDWNFSSFVPKFIVINLGTNDNTYTQKDANKEKEYQDGYVKFLENIRKYNKEATIICTLGIMGQELYSSIEKAVETYKSKTGDKKVTTMKFDQQNVSLDGGGAGWHPSEKTNVKAAALLESTIKSLM